MELGSSYFPLGGFCLPKHQSRVSVAIYHGVCTAFSIKQKFFSISSRKMKDKEGLVFP